MADTIVTSIISQLQPLIKKSIDDELSKIKTHLIASGLDKDVIEKVFSSYDSTALLNTKYELDDGEVLIIENYGNYCHIVYGDFKDTYSTFRTEYLKSQSWLTYNTNIRFNKIFNCCAWVIKVNDKLPEFEKALTKKNINYTKIDRKKFEEHLLKGGKKLSSKTKFQKTEPEKIESSPKQETKTQKLPPSKGKNNKLIIKKNKYGNRVESLTELVFLALPVGKDGKKIGIVIGLQDNDPEEDSKGLDTILPLGEDEIEICRKRKWKYLTKDMVEAITKRNKKLGESLSLFIEDEAELEDSEEEEEEEEV